MRFRVEIDRAVLADLKKLCPFDRRAVLDTAERVLTSTPMQVSKSRIKRLRGTDSPQYRLRVGEFRVFYDVHAPEVYVLRVLSKADVADYLKEIGYEIEDGERGATGAGNGQGGQ